MRLPKITAWRLGIAIFLLMGIYVSVLRFAYGLGAVTHLSDRYPWGLWIGFDLLCGVALAGGGFSIAAAVYVFHLEKYRPILRPTLLTAYLGYLIFCLSLFYDLGKYYNIWHPVVMWNPHSVMFEVAWCVILYTLVLTLEFMPVFIEGLKKHTPRFHRSLRLDTVGHWLHKAVVPTVILGVILSTLHQSSLGSLFLIVPGKVHELWYSPLLPFFFFISSISTGLAMVTFESFLSSRFLGRGIHHRLLQGLARVNVVVLAIYLVLKLEDLLWKGSFSLIWQPSYESLLFDLELGLGVVVPLVMFASARVRASKPALFVASMLVVVGTVLNRTNVAMTGVDSYAGGGYFPAFYEIMISVFMVTIGFVIFALVAKYFPVFPAEEPAVKKQPVTPPAWSPPLPVYQTPHAGEN